MGMSRAGAARTCGLQMMKRQRGGKLTYHLQQASIVIELMSVRAEMALQKSLYRCRLIVKSYVVLSCWENDC